MVDSRTKNTIRNIVAGLTNRFISIVLPFINRTVILWTLGEQFAGLGSLFQSILQVLNIADLGFNSAIVYSLYEPFAKKDERRICQLVTLYKKIYNVVGTIIIGSGLCIMPFITLMIKGDYPTSINIYIVFLLYLTNSGISYYLFAYKEALLIADQRQDIATNIRCFVNIARYLGQFIALIISKSFYAYLIIALIGTIITNVLIERETKRRYLFFYKVKEKVSLPAGIKTQVKGLLINKLCDTCRNSFDNLIISTFIGLTATAIYGNYYYIYNSLYYVMLEICNAMSASVGNSIVWESKEKNFKDLLLFSYIFSWIFGWCTICLLCLYQPFMKLWAGESLMLSSINMILFCIYFYVINLNNIRNQYIIGVGMWWDLRIPYIVEALSNLGLNILFGKVWGITGVLLATIITIFFFNFIWRTHILFKDYFKGQKTVVFWKNTIYYTITITITSVITYYISSFIKFSDFFDLLVKGIICLVVPNTILFLFYFKRKEFLDARKLIVKAGGIFFRKK